MIFKLFLIKFMMFKIVFAFFFTWIYRNLIPRISVKGRCRSFELQRKGRFIPAI